MVWMTTNEISSDTDTSISKFLVLASLYFLLIYNTLSARVFSNQLRTRTKRLPNFQCRFFRPGQRGAQSAVGSDLTKPPSSVILLSWIQTRSEPLSICEYGSSSWVLLPLRASDPIWSTLPLRFNPRRTDFIGPDPSRERCYAVDG